MPAFLFTIIAALIEGQSFASVLEGISLAQWLTIGGTVAADVAPSLAARLGVAHPSLGALVAAIGSGLNKEFAAQAGHAWLKQNYPATISGYGADGGVIDIPNPDYKE
jgi:hypothetical protein